MSTRRLIPVASGVRGSGGYDEAIEHLQRACGIEAPIPLAELDEHARQVLASALDLVGDTVRRAVALARSPANTNLPKPE